MHHAQAKGNARHCNAMRCNADTSREKSQRNVEVGAGVKARTHVFRCGLSHCSRPDQTGHGGGGRGSGKRRDFHCIGVEFGHEVWRCCSVRLNSYRIRQSFVCPSGLSIFPSRRVDKSTSTHNGTCYAAVSLSQVSPSSDTSSILFEDRLYNTLLDHLHHASLFLTTFPTLCTQYSLTSRKR